MPKENGNTVNQMVEDKDYIRIFLNGVEEVKIVAKKLGIRVDSNTTKKQFTHELYEKLGVERVGRGMTEEQKTAYYEKLKELRKTLKAQILKQ